jgi:hypothetical protein
MVSQNELWKKVSEDANLLKSQGIDAKKKKMKWGRLPPHHIAKYENWNTVARELE